MANIEIAATTGRQVVLNADVIEQFRTETAWRPSASGRRWIRCGTPDLQRDDRPSARDYRPLRRGR
jgi:hypothetical protein